MRARGSGDPVIGVDPDGLSGGLLGTIEGGFDKYVVQPVIRDSGTISVVAGGASLVAYGFCWAGGSGCAVGAILSRISATAASTHAAQVCASQGVDTACVANATGAAVSIVGSGVAGRLASAPDFESLPNYEEWMFAKTYGQKLSGQAQVLAGAGTWALSFGAQQGLAQVRGSRGHIETFSTSQTCPA